MKNKILNKINNRTAIIGVIGLGYVGLPLLIRFSEEGFKTIGFDINKKIITNLNKKQSYIKHINEEKIKSLIKSGFIGTTTFKKIVNVDVILICVPTPLGQHNEPDLRYIKSTLNSIKPYLINGQIIILESTTYPGTTEEEIIPLIESLGFSIGKDFFVGYSPEREDPGNKQFDTRSIPKVVSGITNNCLFVIKALYDSIVNETVPVSSTRVAEMTKILENIHRAVNIGLINELKMITHKMNIDIYEVIRAASTKPFGFSPFYPGPGLGGHCIPIDPFYLSWKAKEVDMNTRFIELAGEINTFMPHYVVEKIISSLNDVGKPLAKSRVLILGIAYKKNIDDLRESPSLKILEILMGKKAIVEYNDPYFESIPKTRNYNFKLNSIELNKDTLKSFDLVLLATDHDIFDYELIINNSSLIVDTRGKFKNNKNVIRA